MLTCDAALLSFGLFVETVRRAAIVYTDRLHTMILGALLQKPVRAYSANFQKLESVWARSGGDWADVKFPN